MLGAMTRPLSVLRPALSLIAAAALAACAPALAPDPAAPPPEGAEIRALPSGEALSFGELAARAAEADLVVVGEIHDQPAHQQMQAALIAAIRARAAAFEMVPAEKTEALAALRAAPGGPTAADDAAKAAAGWDRYIAWAPPIAALAPGAPAIGAGQPRAALRKAVMEGSGAAAFDGDAARFGLDMPLPDDMQAAMVEEQVEAHCGALPAAMAPGMVEAQRLRDAAFAAALLAAREAGDPEAGPPVLVTGNGHARRGRGSPRYLSAAAPELSVFVIGQAIRSPGQDWQAALAPWAGKNPDGPVFDAVVLVEAEGRGEDYDPCAGLRARAEKQAGK